MSNRTALQRIVLALAAAALAVSLVATREVDEKASPSTSPPPEAVVTIDEDDPAPAAARGGERLVARLEAVSTRRDGGHYQASTPTGDGDASLSIGETASVYVGLGTFDADGVSITDRTGMNCTGSVRASEADARLAWALDRAPHLWWADVRALPSRFGELRFEVDWRHYRSDRRGQPVVVAGDVREITLRQDESHHLDFVDFSQADRHYRNVLIRLRADVREDPEFEHALLQYDLWWRHRDARGRDTTRHFRAVATQGERLEFRFAPMRSDAPDLALADGTRVDAILDTIGAVRGRLRADGTVDVDFGATRWATIERAGDPRRGGIGVGGNRVVTVVPGEAVGFRFPEHQGRSGLGLSADERTLDHSAFYEGHEDTLILTVERAED